MTQFTPAKSKLGRSLISPGSTHNPYVISKEIAEWNARIDARKRDKILLKAARLAAERNSFASAYANRVKVPA